MIGWQWNELLLMEWHYNDGMTMEWVFVLEWPMNDKIRIEWGQNEKEKNQGHLPCFKNSSHSTLIPVILNHSRMRKSSFQHRFNHSEVIRCQNGHGMTIKSFQNDFKWQGWTGMEVIKISSIKNSRHSTPIPVIQPPFHHSSIIHLMGHSYHSKLKVSPPITLCRGWWVDWLWA